MNRVDLIAILGNLLDNALEAIRNEDDRLRAVVTLSFEAVKA
ncbi:GHKL domain-containing protein [Lachnospiraceae bacterium WCA-9-b2]|uniref:GHKL domain-containing protein n=1 Tax=Sporofaciens musculi TaxID=2681861 RepID=A0A7X3SKZ4_9FIRM|nr:GHKL domain-containing protein [Sporofaciens musculi]MXP78024.1 GHKL domain-containing protein [Sporofaciens musculi]